jgi:hypothetical protein
MTKRIAMESLLIVRKLDSYYKPKFASTFNNSSKRRSAV